MARTRLPLLVLSLAALLAACGSTAPTPSPAGSPVGSPAASPSTPAEGESAPPSDAPATPAPSDPATPAPTVAPAPSMTPEQARLMTLLRADVLADCAARTADLPEGAQYGIECRPDDPLAARVGIYWYPSVNEAATAFLNRMADAGVDVNSGDCGADKPGEGGYYPGDGEGSLDDPGVFNFENAVLAPQRIGCFLNGDGIANVRLTCGQAYIGILGRKGDLSDLQDWAWRYPDGYEPGTPDVPGVCVGSSVLGD